MEPLQVLILEDEAILRASMARGISRMPDVDVLEAGNFAEALARLDHHDVDLVLSDIDLPDKSGLEIIGELRARGKRTPIVFISAYLKSYRSAIPPNAGVEVREKPVSLEDLRALVERHLDEKRRSTSAEAPTPFTAADYVQLAAMGHHSVVVAVEGGEIVMVDGQLHAARDARGEGDEAFRRLALKSSARCHTLRGAPPSRNVEGRWEFLLMDAARELDEGAPDIEEPAPLLEATEEAAPPSMPSTDEIFDEIWDDGIAALLAKDYPAALEAFSRAALLRPEHAGVKANLMRLSELGFEAA